MNKYKKYMTLITSTFYLSAFTFGGGFVIIPLMKKKFVDELHWIEDNEMMDLMAIAQSSPGSIAVNASIMVGYKVLGFKGALCATLGTILPPLIILSFISRFYFEFANNRFVAACLGAMQAGIAAVVLDVVLTMGRNLYKENRIYNSIAFIVAFILLYFLNINIIFLIAASAFLGISLKLEEGKD